jgi:hypothetical protein
MYVNVIIDIVVIIIRIHSMKRMYCVQLEHSFAFSSP